jgi:hypothetical protein
MIKSLLGIVAAGFIFAGSAQAMPAPVNQAQPAPQAASELLVKVATQSQRRAARRVCRAQYGSRLTGVFFNRRGGFACRYRLSTRTLTNRAARTCRRKGQRLTRVVGIKSRGGVTTIRFVCRRR